MIALFVIISRIISSCAIQVFAFCTHEKTLKLYLSLLSYQVEKRGSKVADRRET